MIHETLANSPKLLPDSAVDVWSLGLIIHCFAQEKLSGIHAALNSIAYEKYTFALVSESYALLTKGCDKSEQKRVDAMLAELDTFFVTKLVGKLSNSMLAPIQLQVLMQCVSFRVRQAVAKFEEELAKIPEAPKECNTLLNLARQALQVEPEKRPSTQAMLDSLLAISMTELKV